MSLVAKVLPYRTCPANPTCPSSDRTPADTSCVEKPMTEPTRDLAIDAVDVLNDLIGDFVAGTLVLLDYHQRHKAGYVTLQQMTGVQKMCLSHLVLAFAKLQEFWDRFHRVVPVEHRERFKELNRALKHKDVKEFRNKVVGHIWDNSLRRPLRHSEIMNRLEALTDGHLSEFLRWVNNPQDNTYPRTVRSIVETVRDSMVTEYGIQPDEVIDR